MRVFALILLLFVMGCQQAPSAQPKPKPKPVFDDSTRDPKTQSRIDPKRIPALQAKATQACLCQRKGDESECWSSFWKEVNEYKHRSSASACREGSSADVDFGYGSGPVASSDSMIVMTTWGYGACSGEEAVVKKAEHERKTARKGC
jgi:hypothetical protein